MTGILEIVDDSYEFFAPVSSDVIDRLIGEYQQYRRHIDHLAGIATGEMSSAIHYFIAGNRNRERYMPSVAELFEPKGAIFALNSAYWSKAMNLTDVYSAMPQARRDFWSAQLNGEKKATVDRREVNIPPLPDFEEDTVRNTLADLLASRARFLAERVDGIFRNLSGEHVTNSPSGFNRRMIISGVTEIFTYSSSNRCGTINDLRAVVAKFMGRDEPKWNSSTSLVAAALRNSGTWIMVDGGAMRIRVYMKGTAHLEVHPDIAYRLNQILAHLHPTAIPAQFRTKPEKRHKEFQMMGRPLPFSVISIISELRRKRNTNSFEVGYGSQYGKVVHDEAFRVLESIGGVTHKNISTVDFDYDPRDVLDEIIASGCIPDKKSHQFYPTPENVASVAIEMAAIGENDTCLEPSAGQGNLAVLMPKERTSCVEISPLHCSILKARGLNAVDADFIKWAETAPKFDRVVMNPPFSEGRAKHHVDVGATLVAPGGRLVAILPASFKNTEILPGWDCTWSDIFNNEFSGTSVSVVILCGVTA